MITDRNKKEIKDRDWIVYKYDDGIEIGGLQVVSQNGELGIIHKSIWGTNEEFIKLSTTDLLHCEVVDHDKKEDRAD